jgi:hypothetical protein
MAGDTTAQIFWLKNRRPNDWKDRHEVNNTNEFPPVVINIVAASQDAIDARKQKAIEASSRKALPPKE